MSSILQFRAPDARAGRIPARRPIARTASAEIVIFPGVRIEREAPRAASRVARRAPSSIKD